MESEEVDVRRRLFSLKTALSFAACLALLAYLATRVDLAATWTIVAGASPWWFLAAFVAYYASFPVRGLRWQVLLRNNGISERWPRLAELVFFSYFVNSILPAKLGDVYKAYLLRRNYGHPMRESGGSILMERVLDVLVLALLFSGCGLLAFGTAIPETYRPFVYAGFVGGVLVVAFLVGAKRATLGLARRLSARMPERVRVTVVRLVESFFGSMRASSMPAIVGLTLVSWLLEGLRIWFIVLALGIQLPFPAVAFVAFAASFLTAIPLTPAGLGAVELGMVGILFLFGVPVEVGAAVALLDRMVSFWLLLALGGVWSVATPRRVV